MPIICSDLYNVLTIYKFVPGCTSAANSSTIRKGNFDDKAPKNLENLGKWGANVQSSQTTFGMQKQ